jgi:hypothetical protein
MAVGAMMKMEIIYNRNRAGEKGNVFSQARRGLNISDELYK